MRTRKTSLQRYRGTTLAEAAFVMTLLCLVTLGALQYGWFFYCLHTATNAARQGARIAAAFNVPLSEGTTALENNLFPQLRSAATTKVVTAVTDPNTGQPCVQGQVIIPKESTAVRLLPLEFLPVPDCRATVVMAKEGTG